MNRRIEIGMAMMAGAVIGAAGLSGLHAQGKPGAYAVIEISDYTDAEGYKQVPVKGGASAAAAGGQFIIRTDKITTGDGDAPKRFVLIHFDDMDKLNAWEASAAQKEVDALRVKTTKSREFFVEGLAN